jgi:GNAT superfamily N-acetyltransferase
VAGMTVETGARLVEEEMAQYFLTVDGQPGARILEDAAAVSIRTPHVDRNRIFRARLAPDTVDDEIARLLQPFRQDLVPVTWYVDSCSTPGDLGAHLVQQGLELRYVWTGMVREASETPSGGRTSADLTVTEAESESEREQWMHLVLEGFGLTQFHDLESLLVETGVASGRWHRLTAFQDGTPIGGALLFAGDGVAGLHWLGVPQMFRKRGAGVLLTRESLAVAARMGYTHLVLQANPDVVQLYLRLGFSSTGDIGLFDWRPGIGSLSVEPD